MPEHDLYYDEIFKIMPRWDKFINLMLNIEIPVGKIGYTICCNNFSFNFYDQGNFAY